MSVKQLKIFDSRNEGFKYYDERIDELLSSLSADVFFMGDNKARSGEVIRSVFGHISEYLKRKSDAIRKFNSSGNAEKEIARLREGYKAVTEIYALYDELMRNFENINAQIEETRNKYPNFHAVEALIYNIDESKAKILLEWIK